MHMLGGIALSWYLAALPPLIAPAAQLATSGRARADMVTLVESVQDADYRGDLTRLRSLAADMRPYTEHPALAPAARYWRKAPRRASEFLAELAPLVEKIRRTARDNPRMIFVVAPTLFWTPPDRGGDREQALAMLERGLRLAASRPPSTDPLSPNWAEAELHMLLAWFCLNLKPPDGTRALPHAETALALRPTWRYVRDSLLPQARDAARVRLTTVAYRVHRMQSMLEFYSEAFGVRFHEVDTGGGLRSQFGKLGGITLKFVPIRDAVDFEGFPIHQLGFEVPDVESALAAARKHGGRVQDEPRLRDGRVHASVRDPDGNTLEIYGPG